ncbi:MAG: 7-cyano-7-deazaguanine synthase [Nanoarchaeota archaeon]|nr:7-cyano-7-deazaguanine synthase [Nanoarchaeota archaeon]
MKKKCIVMFSGGLDSRLVVKIMQEQGFEVLALFFNLPFGSGCCDKDCSFNFAQRQGIKLKIFDCTRGKLLKEYLNAIKRAKHGRGAGINPCIDCRIFMFKKAKELADKKRIDLVVSGEVLGERPMSQMKKSMEIVEEKSGLNGRLLRPLSAKFFPKTNAEEKDFVNREKLYNIQGRRREKQIALAKKFKITFPSPAGGCLLCEKALKERFKFLLKRGIREEEAKLVGVGRHFLIDYCWIVLGRDEKENKIIELVGEKTGKLIVPDSPGPSAVILDKCKKKTLEKVHELIRAYSKGGGNRIDFEKYKL